MVMVDPSILIIIVGSAPEAALSGKIEAGILEVPLRRRHLHHANIASP